ncbi:MAG: glycolate oxidase subunit GlcE [Pseudomonadota bacterium]
MPASSTEAPAGSVSDRPILSPGSEAELAEAVLDADGPLRPRGGGTRDIGRPVDGQILSLDAVAGIVRHDPGALTLVARAGTPLAEIESTLASAGQRLPFEPMDHRALLGTQGVPTIGGAVATNASGPRRIQAGACRDSLIGVRFVDGAGRTVKNGGRVMKNVTGYDLVKLMAGSFGTLGVLTEVSFKVLPAPDARATLRIEGLSEIQAIEALSEALGSPYDVTGAAHIAGDGATDGTLVRIEGLSASVAYRAERLAAELGRYGPVELLYDPEKSDAIWQGIRDVARFAGREGDVWRLSVRPTDAAEIAQRLGDLPRFFDWGGGLIWVLAAPGTDLRARLGSFRGHATLVRAADETRLRLPVFQPEPGPLAALATRLRASFDPRGILNPGLMAAPEQAPA